MARGVGGKRAKRGGRPPTPSSSPPMSALVPSLRCGILLSMNRITRLGSTLLVAGTFAAHALGVKLPADKSLQYESLQYIKPPLVHAEQWTGYEVILQKDSIVVTTTGTPISYSPESLPPFGSGTMPD